MSAHIWSGEVKRTKRYELGRKLSDQARHLLLMTATPHSGKEEDFQLFMSLIDSDRFSDHPRDGPEQPTWTTSCVGPLRCRGWSWRRAGCVA